MNLAITGANSGVGRILLRHLAERADTKVVACVRSTRSADSLPLSPGVSVRAIDYHDRDGLANTLTGSSSVIHLAGILFETPTTSYQTANIDATQAVTDACKKAGVRFIVLVSALGADPRSANRYRQSKWRAEHIVSESGLAAAIIRTPILLGPAMAGARAVAHAASRHAVTLLGGGRHVIRPLDVDDLSRAILRWCEQPRAGVSTYELVGPEHAAYREVIARTAALMGHSVSVRSMPIWLAKSGAAINGYRRDHVGRNRARERGRRTRRYLDAVDDDAREAPEVGRPVCALVTEPDAPKPSRTSTTLGRLIFFAAAAACFLFLYYRLNDAAAREGLSLLDYMRRVFANVRWLPWLLLMAVYSCLYLAIDTLVLARALSWFIKPIRYGDILPIRASAYILSLVSEQVGKGAMAYYLNQRHDVPGWEVGSVMLFIMFGEIFYLLVWATVGFAVSRSSLPPAFGILPFVSLGAAVAFALWVLYFRGTILPASQLRGKRIFHAFRMATLKHYALFFLLRSPALLIAVIVYTIALNLFGVHATMRPLLGYLPIIFFAATVPTPMRAAAIALWVVLFPNNEGQMAAFGFVQHNFFILFNALIGVVFLRRAQRELFGR